MSTSISENNMKIKLHKVYKCKYCNKESTDKSNHEKHVKTCKVKKFQEQTQESALESIKNNINETKENELMEIIKQQQEQLKILLEKSTQLSTEENYILPKKQTFNLNSFLNETCKDAINILDYLNNFTVSDDEFVNIGIDANYRKNINYINKNNINVYSTLTRPFHTSNLKEKTIWIKGDMKTIKYITGTNKFECIDNQKLNIWIKADISDILTYWKKIAHIIFIKAVAWQKVYCKYGCSYSYDDKYDKSIINLMSLDYEDKCNCSQLINYLLNEIIIEKKEY